MLSRRRFLKQLALSLVAASGGAAAVYRLLTRQDSTAPAAPVEETQPLETVEVAAKTVPSEPLLSLFLLSDVHISAFDPTISNRLHTALKDITKLDSPVEAIIFGGDLTDFGRASEYKQLRGVLNQYKLPPLYANMGNHDYYDIWLTDKDAFSTETMPNGKTDAMARARFMEFFKLKKPYSEAWINGVHFILLSQEAYQQERPEVGEGAWYSEEQLQWFEKTMETHRDGSPALIFIHQPLPERGSDGGTHRLIPAKRFRAILEPYANAFVFSGHTHRNFRSEDHYRLDGNFHWFNNASVGKTRAASTGPAGTQVQGMYIQVFPDEVVVRGREFTDRTWIDSALWKISLHRKTV